MNRILEAAKIAREAHEGDIRDYTAAPVICHPGRVGGRMATHPLADDYNVAAAFLHDAFEDNPDREGIDRKVRMAGLGGRTIQLMWALYNPSKNMLGLSRPERKKMDREHFRNAEPVVKVIKMFDRIDNLNDMDGASVSFKVTYVAESRLLAEIIGDADEALKVELLEACRRVEESYLRDRRFK